MLTATIELNMDELRTLEEALWSHFKGAHALLDVVREEIEKLELVDMSDWNDCGDACKL